MSGNDIQINDVVMINPELAEALGIELYAEYKVTNIMPLLGDTRAVLRFVHGGLMMAIPLIDLIKVDLTKPDDFIYPDTPAGTKIVAIRDTQSLSNMYIPKGTVLTLDKHYRYFHNKYHQVKENRNFQITGMGCLCVPIGDFRIKVD